jgi:ATP-dependent helicase HrpB
VLSLPVDAHLEEIGQALARHRRLVVTAPPGSGKSTRIPPALVGSGRVVLLQPRRVAARALARRIASERNWTVGREIGWQIRFERRYVKETSLLVATEGVLVRKLLSDPLLSDTSTVILDEFHERSLHADLSIALLKQALLARDDLRVLVMSATLDASKVSSYLDGAPVIEIDGGLHPVEIEWSPGVSVHDAVISLLSRRRGDVLCFLPGAREIRDAARRIERVRPDISLHELHGSLEVERQEAALAPSTSRKVILATNIAETSLTVEGVAAVVDSGLHRVLRYDHSAGIDRLQTERIPMDSAAQRAGRAGRLGPGVAVRLWDPRDELRDHREPEIHRIDLAGALLDVIAWGDDPRRFDWFEAPEADRIAEDLALLESLGAIEEGRLTEDGRMLQRLPVHPRLGRILLSAADRQAAARVCAIVSDGERWASSRLEDGALGADIRLLLERFDDAPASVRRVAAELESMLRSVGEGRSTDPIERAILRGFPDRVAKRREGSREKLLLSGGQGAILAGGGVAPDSEMLVALDVRGSDRSRQAESTVRLASPIESAWLEPTSLSTETRLEGTKVRAVETRYYGAIALGERRVEANPQDAGRLLGDALRQRGIDEVDERLRRRLMFAGIEIDLDAVFQDACAGRTEVAPFRLSDWIAPDARSRLESLAPDRITVPSGRSVLLDYRADGEVVLSVKLQELFGLAETPVIGRRGQPITIELLAPNGRPVQVTSDLRSFWATTYQEVRRELRGRYPKHPWPEDPWTADPTSRAKRRR